MTGGGWWADPFLDVTESRPAGDGWEVQASGDAIGGNPSLIAYAVCFEDTRVASETVFASSAVPDGGAGRWNSGTCPAGSYLTGGGFTMSRAVAYWSAPGISSLDEPRNDLWEAGAVNASDNGPGGVAAALEVSAVCLSVP
jgi:hypothetical protein